MSETEPPAIATGILCFFASQPDFPALMGDLKEEFHQRAQISGIKAATRWFWRETFRTGWALTVGEALRTPILTTLTAVICFIAIGASTALYAYLSQWNLVDLVYGRQAFPVLVVLNVIPSLAVGWTGGRLLQGREWALALTFILISFCMAVFGTLYLLSAVRSDLDWLMTLLMSIHLLRLGCFCLGCLYVRGWSAASSSRSVSAA